MPEGPFYFTPPLQRKRCAFYLVSFNSITVRWVQRKLSAYRFIPAQKQRLLSPQATANVKKPLSAVSLNRLNSKLPLRVTERGALLPAGMFCENPDRLRGFERT
jgi:hypothetical protein